MRIAGGILFLARAKSDPKYSLKLMSLAEFWPPSWNFGWTCTSGFTVILYPGHIQEKSLKRIR